jgi:hypothetical protein
MVANNKQLLSVPEIGSMWRLQCVSQKWDQCGGGWMRVVSQKLDQCETGCGLQVEVQKWDQCGGYMWPTRNGINVEAAGCVWSPRNWINVK